MFNKIHHIAIIGSDYNKSKHFYVDLLGFRIIRESKRENNCFGGVIIVVLYILLAIIIGSWLWY